MMARIILSSQGSRLYLYLIIAFESGARRWSGSSVLADATKSQPLENWYLTARQSASTLSYRYQQTERHHDKRNSNMNIRRAVQNDVSRIMEIRHLVRENRLSHPNLVTADHCAEFIER